MSEKRKIIYENELDNYSKRSKTTIDVMDNEIKQLKKENNELKKELDNYKIWLNVILDKNGTFLFG